MELLIKTLIQYAAFAAVVFILVMGFLYGMYLHKKVLRSAGIDNDKERII